MVRLVVAEKPSVARDLARVLGASQRRPHHFAKDGLWITWCRGHMAELCEPAHYDAAWKAWSTAHLPMVPGRFALRPVAAARAEFLAVAKLLRDRRVHEVVNACDAGREGELIFRYVYELARCRHRVVRLWLSSLTDVAIRAGFGRLQPAKTFDALGDAARCRSEADWLVGLNATRALTLKQRAKGRGPVWTVGRVQTPTLALLVRREAEIEAFVPEPFWQVHARLTTAAGASFRATYTHPKNGPRLEEAARAEAIATAARGAQGRVEATQQRDRVEPPPLLYDLTSLQRRANQVLKASAAATLAAAQALYEKHKAITYPRTDSNYLTRDMQAELPAILRSLGRPPYADMVQHILSKQVRCGPRIVCDAEVGDHHAIIPTGRSIDPQAMAPLERSIFDLVARRFIAAFLPAAVFAQSRIDTLVAGHSFIARGTVCKEAGWQRIDPPPRPRPPPHAKLGSLGAADENALLPQVVVGEQLEVGPVDVHEAMTKPPPRYTEAVLLGAMERAGATLDDAALKRALKDAGLGTPATRAAIIEGLHKRAFIERQGTRLVATSAGRALVDAVTDSSLTSAALTGAWEARLAQVANGRLSREAFMGDVTAYTRQLVRRLLAPQAACPRCRQGHVIAGKKALGCSRWRAGCDWRAAPPIA